MYFNKKAITAVVISVSISIQMEQAGPNDPLNGPVYDAPINENWAPSKYWGA